MEDWLIVISVLLVIIQIIIAWLTYQNVHRHRIIHEIKRYDYHTPSSSPPFLYSNSQSEDYFAQINNELKTGKFTILQMVARNEYDIDVYLGRIKE